MAARAAGQPAAGATAARRPARRKSSARRLDASLLLHVLALAWYLRVWLWHFTPAAAKLPGAQGFGWFSRYLTFYSFTLQLAQLALCVVSRAPTAPKLRASLSAWADDLSCALFGLANVVTIMYYILEATTKDVVEGGAIERPPWLGFAVHLSNSMTAWADMLLAPRRSFSARASRLSMALVATYIAWLLTAAHFNGAFPYPFLNKLPWPQGFVGVAVAAQLLFVLLFMLGSRLRRLLRTNAAA